jgi:hypothetical protein
MASQREGDRDGGVQMSARQVPGGGGHGGDHEPEGHGDPDRAEPAEALVGDDRATPGQHEEVASEPLGERPPPEREGRVHA